MVYSDTFSASVSLGFEHLNASAFYFPEMLILLGCVSVTFAQRSPEQISWNLGDNVAREWGFLHQAHLVFEVFWVSKFSGVLMGWTFGLNLDQTNGEKTGKQKPINWGELRRYGWWKKPVRDLQTGFFAAVSRLLETLCWSFVSNLLYLPLWVEKKIIPKFLPVALFLHFPCSFQLLVA